MSITIINKQKHVKDKDVQDPQVHNKKINIHQQTH